MSLFGSSPDEPSLIDQTRRPESKSLFDDRQTPAATSNTSLFDDNSEGPSPWEIPTPKKASKGDLVRTLLPASSVPESYIDVYDTLLEAGYKTPSANIGPSGLQKIFEGSRIESTEQARILRLVTNGQNIEKGLGRSEFNVLLALMALSQQDEEATLDGVDERRRNLPEPLLPGLKTLRSAKVSDNLDQESPPQQESATPPGTTSNAPTSPPKSRRLQRDSLENLVADPWASPALHKDHTHTVNNEVTPTDSTTVVRPIDNGILGPSRTTSAFTTNVEDSISKSVSIGEDSASRPPADGGSGGWGSYGTPSNGFASARQPEIGGEGFGSGGDNQENHSQGPGGRSIDVTGTPNRILDEIITVTLLPEKEGIFMFQHHNYEVKSARRASTVVRRYSDFVWLLDCLHKRYPFRQLPLLPPKRVAVNGRHLSADVTFIEKRRRGLVRFVNALVRHPVLSLEQLVTMFLTVPTELAVWRKQATISVQEEFNGRALPSGLEDSLPTNLSETFDTVQAGVRRSVEAYVSLCGLLERLAKRNQGVAADCLRFSHGLIGLTETTESTYAVDASEVSLLNQGISCTAQHLTTTHNLLEDEARAWDEGVLEDFKKQRDALVSVRELFDRRDRYAKDSIPQLERRIESNEHKLAQLMARPEGMPVKPGEQEKLEEAVRADKQLIVDQHARGVLIKECIRDELAFFQQSQYLVSRLHQDWSQERVKYAELQADNWRALSEELENMPLGE